MELPWTLHREFPHFFGQNAGGNPSLSLIYRFGQSKFAFSSSIFTTAPVALKIANSVQIIIILLP
jgi:hypothetical protein